MVDHNELTTQSAQHDIINPDMDKREFKITIGIRSYWITKSEMEKYLVERVKPGVDHVALRDGLLLLPLQYQDIVHRTVIEDSEKIEEGRWQCDIGAWHKVGATCYCNIELVQTDEQTMRLEEKTIKPLPVPVKHEHNNYPLSRQLIGSVKPF